MARIGAVVLGGLMLAASSDTPSKAWIKPETASINCSAYHSEVVASNVYNNNVWNKGAAKDFTWKQCIERHPVSGLLGWSWTWPSGRNAIFAYPQIKRGVSPWLPWPLVPSELPVSHNSLSALRISHELDIATNGQHNVATTFWLTSTDDIGKQVNTSVILAELMVWTYATQGHMRPAGVRTAEVDLDGQQWEVWVNKDWGNVSGDSNNRWIYLTFLAKKPSLQASFDVVKLARYAVEQNILPAAFFYADVELGTEIMSGSGLAWVKRFEVQPQRLSEN